MATRLLAHVVAVLCFAVTLPAAAQTCDRTGLFDRVGSKYGIDPWLLYAIALEESGARPHITSAPNKNGTTDLGAMQINEVHLPALTQLGIRKADLFNPCVNVDVGGWILRRCFAVWGVTWDGVGCYNSSNPTPRRQYATKIYRRYLSLARSTNLPGPPAQHTAYRCAHATGCWVRRTQDGLEVTANTSRTSPLMVQ